MAQFVATDVGVDNSLGTVTLDRPDRLHALSDEVLSDLEEAFTRLEEESVRTIILESTGETAFVSGADLKEYQDFESAKEFGAFLDHQNATNELIENHPAHVIAAVDGIAYGGGFELALSADMIVADQDASFAFPEVSRGLIPSGGGIQRLSRIVGPTKATEFVSTGRPMSAEEAKHLGVINRIASESDVREVAEELASEILENAPRAVRATKEVLRWSQDTSLDHAIAHNQQILTALFDSPEANEGIEAFVEKRDPEFDG